jgi:hypothetical protein
MAVPTTAVEGFVAELSIGGTLVSLLTGVTLKGDRSQTPWRPMGDYNPLQILKGRRNFEGTASKAYVCGDWLDLFMVNCYDYAATIYPRGQTICPGTVGACGTIAGSIAIKSWSLSGMVTETEAAVIEEIAFDMYEVTTP